MEIIARVKEIFQKEIDEVIKVRDRVGIEVKSEDRVMDMTKSQKMRDLLRDYGIKW